jgi:hypothetical protein
MTIANITTGRNVTTRDGLGSPEMLEGRADRRFRAADFCVARPCGRTQINQIFAT